MDDEPLYVNARQYHRILKRRVARAREAEVRRLSQRKVCPHPPALVLSQSHLTISDSTSYKRSLFTYFSTHSTDSSFPRFPTSSPSTRFCLFT